MIASTRKRGSLLAACAALVAAGCASSGTQPHAMAAGQHEAAAGVEEQAAKEHSAQYDPSQEIVVPPAVNCPFFGYGVVATGQYCYGSWTSVRNPTARHLAEGKRHAELAAQHRAASQALRDAEARACKNVPPGDRDVSPFYHREDILSVEPVKQSVAYGGGPVIGAEVVFASLPGMTAEWLQRVVSCHLARNAVIDDAAQEMAYCPLAVRHAAASVRSAGNGFAVDITSTDDQSVKEIVARAGRLTAKAGH